MLNNFNPSVTWHMTSDQSWRRNTHKRTVQFHQKCATKL